MQEISFGQYALPIVLMVGLSFFYKIFDRSDGTSAIPGRLKPLIAIALGIGLGIVGLFYNGIVPTFKNLVDHVLYGFMTGCSAIGLWEGFKAVRESNGAAKIVKSIVIIFVASALIVSCATFESTTYKTMYTMGTAYDAAMKSASYLYQQDRLTQDQVARIIELSKIYYIAYQEAVIAFEIYKKSKEAADKTKTAEDQSKAAANRTVLETIMTKLSEKHAEIVAYIEKLKN